MDKTVAELKKLATSGEGRPQPNPVQGQSRSNTTEAPGSFYGGSIGKLRDVNAPAFINKQGLPSTGREEAILGCTAAAQYAKDPSSIEPSRHIFNEFSLSNRVGVVTGAAGGLGLEMALGLVEAGATIYCVDLAPEETDTFKEARDYAAAFGGKMFYLNGNVTDQQKMRSVFQEIVKRENRLDVCVAAAGILSSSPLLDADLDIFSKVMNVNVNGVFVTASECARQMKELGLPGSIVLIASMSGSITNRDEPWTAYNASKAACLPFSPECTVQMARSMACELGPLGIRVCSLSPGHIRTNLVTKFLDSNPDQEEKWADLNPLHRIGKLHEVRGACVWLASDASSYVTGSDIFVDGGHHAW